MVESNILKKIFIAVTAFVDPSLMSISESIALQK
jgi:hypothetical protein